VPHTRPRQVDATAGWPHGCGGSFSLAALSTGGGLSRLNAAFHTIVRVKSAIIVEVFDHPAKLPNHCALIFPQPMVAENDIT
jgi:hypothetical protein